MPEPKPKRETIHRVTFVRPDKTLNTADFRNEDMALKAISSSLREDRSVSCRLDYLERDVGGWRNERVLRRREWDHRGREIMGAA